MSDATAIDAQQGRQAMAQPKKNVDFYANYSRFEIELEFVQSLSNPVYLSHLASQKILDDPDFVRYLDYLQYFREPAYLRFLQYPGPTLRVLELLQQENFRKDILAPATLDRMWTEQVGASHIQQ